jgi:hypothetical protein
MVNFQAAASINGLQPLRQVEKRHWYDEAAVVPDVVVTIRPANHCAEQSPMAPDTQRKIGAVTIDPDLRRVFEVAVEGAATLNVMVDELISEGVRGDSKSDQRIAMLLYHYLAAHCKAESEKLFKRLSDKATTEGARAQLCLDMSSGSEESAAQIGSLSQLEGLLARLSW